MPFEEAREPERDCRGRKGGAAAREMRRACLFPMAERILRASRVSELEGELWLLPGGEFSAPGCAAGDLFAAGGDRLDERVTSRERRGEERSEDGEELRLRVSDGARRMGELLGRGRDLERKPAWNLLLGFAMPDTSVTSRDGLKSPFTTGPLS